MYKNPFYIAELQASNCQVELLVNDLPCFNQYNNRGEEMHFHKTKLVYSRESLVLKKIMIKHKILNPN